LRCGVRSLPKELFELRVFEFFDKVGFEILEAIAMGRTREDEVDSVEETFLTIREEDESFVDEGLKGLALDDG